MNQQRFAPDVVIVEEEVQFTLSELSRVCRVDHSVLIAMVREGVLMPKAEIGQGSEALATKPEQWHFDGSGLRRARTAMRLARDLELNPASTALVLDLLDEIEALRGHLRRIGAH